MTHPSPSRGDREAALAEHVRSKVAVLQDRYRRRDGDALAAMANLRRGVTRAPGVDPALWELTLVGMPTLITDVWTRDERDGAATVWERAAYNAITLHAVHQQSRTERMHRTGSTFGAAVATLGQRAGSSDAVRARFHAVGVATDHDTRLVHLRGIITQLRSHDIPLDYARLAVDLACLDDGTHPERVLLKWGRDYHRQKKATANTTATANTDNGSGDPQ
ncbi:type I-E CRISPR-associated protein Cse2/CasB [Nocardia takedensis]